MSDQDILSAEILAPQPRLASPRTVMAEMLAQIATNAAEQAVLSMPRSSNGSKISLARMLPMFDGEDKSRWDTWQVALTDYIGAYESEFDSDKRKVYYTISLLEKSDSSSCPVAVWKRNWKKRTVRGGYLSELYTFKELIEELEASFKDQNGMQLAHLHLTTTWQGKVGMAEFI
ncbi:hypothetical protein K438DRAFT_1761629 [Mycena galopus ATCC 62051]|nr:hypothetical protein K438DRAFT_1761629 [Mycena galopus ATCC 62051]